MPKAREVVYSNLIGGSAFKSKIPTNATSITFTTTPIPEEKISVATLVSSGVEEAYIYLEGTKCYVSPKNRGVILRGNSNCDGMFYGLTSITYINFLNFDATLISNMNSMFQGCSSLVYLDLSNFKTDNVVSMLSTFQGCSSLVEIDINGIKTSNVTTMNNMFHSCRSLKTIDISNFNMDNVTTMNNMFYNCTVLETIGALYVSAKTVNKLAKVIISNIDKIIYISESEVSKLEEVDKINYIVYKQSTLTLDSSMELNGLTDLYDELDLISGKFTKYIGERPYSEGDESNLEVKTNMIKTLYKLEEPVITYIDIKGQKLYSNDGTTYYECLTGNNSPIPLLAINIPTNIAQLVNSQSLDIEEQSSKIRTIDNYNNKQDDLINITMLATDEMFMMLEPLLSDVNTFSLERSVSKMVDMYVAMVQRGLKTIEQVPERYREQVKEVLTKLEN